MPKTDHRVTLTDTKIKGLKPAKKGQRYQVMDAMVPGFGVRVTETGSRTYILRTRYPGSDSPSRREIGKCEVLSLSEARERARKWRELVGKGIDPADEEERKRYAEILKSQATFAAVVEDFIRDKLPTERKGKDVEREIRLDLLPKWERLAITEITDRHVSALIKAKARSGRGGAPSRKAGARNLLALIKRFFRWVVDQPEYGLSVSPCANIRATGMFGFICHLAHCAQLVPGPNPAQRRERPAPLRSAIASQADLRAQLPAQPSLWRLAAQAPRAERPWPLHPEIGGARLTRKFY